MGEILNEVFKFYKQKLTYTLIIMLVTAILLLFTIDFYTATYPFSVKETNQTNIVGVTHQLGAQYQYFDFQGQILKFKYQKEKIIVFEVSIIDLTHFNTIFHRKCIAYDFQPKKLHNFFYIFNENHLENTYMQNLNITCYIHSEEHNYLDKMYLYKWSASWLMVLVLLICIISIFFIWICVLGWCQCERCQGKIKVDDFDL